MGDFFFFINGKGNKKLKRSGKEKQKLRHHRLGKTTTNLKNIYIIGPAV